DRPSELETPAKPILRADAQGPIGHHPKRREDSQITRDAGAIWRLSPDRSSTVPRQHARRPPPRSVIPSRKPQMRAFAGRKPFVVRTNIRDPAPAAVTGLLSRLALFVPSREPLQRSDGLQRAFEHIALLVL